MHCRYFTAWYLELQKQLLANVSDLFDQQLFSCVIYFITVNFLKILQTKNRIVFNDQPTFIRSLNIFFDKMGAMCGQSYEASCIISRKDKAKIAIYGPPKTGKTSLLSYLFNRQNSKLETMLITGAKKQEYLNKFYCPSSYNGTKFQKVSERNKMLVQSKKDNGLPYHLWNVYAQSNADKSPTYRISFAQIKNSEGNMLPMLQGLFLSTAFIMVVDASTIDELYKFQRLSIHSTSQYRVILLNKIDQLSQQSAQKWYKYLKYIYNYSCTIIPISSKDGDNIFHHSERTNWYTGPTLIEILQGEKPEFFQGIISRFRWSPDILVIKVSHNNKKTTTIFGIKTGGETYGTHIQYVLQVKCLFLKSHQREVPQTPTSLKDLQTLIGTITFFDASSIKQAGYKCLIHYHNKVVKGYIHSYTISYNNDELKRHGTIHLLQLLWHKKTYGFGQFYVLDQKNNPIAVGVQEDYRIPYSAPRHDLQPIKKEPLKIEEQVQYKITFEMKSKRNMQ